MKAIHLTDWHSSYLETVRFMESLGLKYDEDVGLVCVTGDMLPNYEPLWVAGFEEEQADRQRYEWCQIAEHFQATWPQAEIVAVPGNHDWCDYGIPGLVKSFDKFESEVFEAQGLKIAGFRGVPVFTGRWNGELNDRIIDVLIEGLDYSADIFLTHTPPYGVLDSPNRWAMIDTELQPFIRHVGAVGMVEFFNTHPWVKRRCHLFGHIHEECGMVEQNGVLYSNASGSCNVFHV